MQALISRLPKRSRLMLLWRLGCVLLLPAAVGGSVFAANSNWLPNVSGSYLWHDNANWDNLIPVNTGGVVGTLHRNGQTHDIDLSGASVILDASRVKFNGGHWTINDTGGGASFNADFLDVSNATNSFHMNVPLNVGTLFTRMNPNRPVNINSAFTILTAIDKGAPGSQGRETLNINASPVGAIPLFKHNNWITNFNAAGAITQLDFISGHSTNTFNANAPLAIGTLNMTMTPNRLDPQTFNVNSTGVTVGTLNWQYGVWKASVDGGLTPLGATPTVLPNTVLNVAAQQSVWPGSTTISTDGALVGDVRGAVFSGLGQNVTFQPDAILGVTNGTEPTRAEVGGATLLRAVTSFADNNTVWTAGDTGSNIYRGLAMGAPLGSGGVIRGEFRANAGSGDLEAKVISPVSFTHNVFPKWIGDGVSHTANIEFSPTGSLAFTKGFNTNVASWSAADQADAITTFNLFRQPGNENTTILSIGFNGQAPKIPLGQTVNVSGGRVIIEGLTSGGSSTGKFLGRLNITNGIIAVPNRADTFVPDSGVLGLGDGAVLHYFRDVNANLRGKFEGLAGGRLDLFGDTQVYFELDRNTSTIHLDYGVNPVFEQIILNSDVLFGGDRTAHIDDNDLAISDGKYIIGVSNRNQTVDAVSGQKITGANPGATIGIANISTVRTFTVDMDVDVAGGTLNIGSDDPLTSPNRADGNRFLTGVPGGRVVLARNVTADTVQVQSGIAQFQQDLNVPNLSISAGATLTMDAGRTATVSGAFGGSGLYNGGDGVVVTGLGSLNPGDGIGVITGNSLVLQNEAAYNWEIMSPTGAAGTEWDLSVSNLLDVQGELNFNIIELGLSEQIEEADTFVVGVADTINNFDPDNVVFSVLPDQYSWNLDAASLIQQAGTGPFAGRQVLLLSGLTAQLQGAAVPEPAGIALWLLIGLLLSATGASRLRQIVCR